MTIDLHAITEAAKAELETWLLEVEADARQMMKDEGRDFEGNTSQSITSRVDAAISGSEARITGEVGAGTSYARQVHEGRAPGRMPPYEPIRHWVEKKLGIASGERESVDVAFSTKDGKDVAFTAQVDRQRRVTQAVRHKIATEGTEGTPFLRQPFEELVPELQPRLERAIAAALEGLQPPPITIELRDPFV